MGTYTTNYQLYMPTVGETGWGTLVNGNFTTIDTTMKSLSNKITAVENEVNGNLSCTSVTTSGKVTANGGLSTKALTATTGTFSDVVTAKNVNKFGYIPMTLALLGTSIPYIATKGGYPTIFDTGYVDANNTTTVSIHSGQLQALYGETIEFKVLPVIKTDNAYIMINEIKIVGSWSLSILHTNDTGKLTVYLNNTRLTNAGTTITAAKAVEILSNINTVKLVNSDTTSFQSTTIEIGLKNTGTVRQYIRDYPIGFY